MSAPIPPSEGLDIVNQALVLLRELEITSFEENTVPSRTARRLYEPTVRQVMCEGWHFCSGKQQLQRRVQEPLDVWDSAYQMPEDPPSLKTNNIRINDLSIEFQQYESYIACNAAANDVVIMDYVYRAPEILFPPPFTEVLVLQLASKMAVPVTGKTELKTAYREDYDRELDQARLTEFSQSTTRRMDVGRIKRGRRSGVRTR